MDLLKNEKIDKRRRCRLICCESFLCQFSISIFTINKKSEFSVKIKEKIDFFRLWYWICYNSGIMYDKSEIPLKKYIQKNIAAIEWYRLRTELFQFMQTCIKEGHFNEQEQTKYERMLEDFTRFENAFEENDSLNDTFKETVFEEASLLYGVYHYIGKYPYEKKKEHALIELMQEALDKCTEIERMRSIAFVRASPVFSQ